MAVTGLALVGFVVGHLLGNLQIFLGPDTLNAYGALLHSNVELLWGARIGLLVCIFLHICMAISLSSENRAARPVGYAVNNPPEASFSSKTMLISGLIILCFIVYHLLHFTAQYEWVNGTGQNFQELVDEKGRHDVYSMVIVGFRNPFVSLFYLLGVGLLCLHLSHGVSAMFQSLGLKTTAWEPVITKASDVIAVLLLFGYASIPLAVMFGIIGKEVVK